MSCNELNTSFIGTKARKKIFKRYITDIKSKLNYFFLKLKVHSKKNGVPVTLYGQIDRI